MKRFVLICLIFSLSQSMTFGQELQSKDSITYEKGFAGYKFFLKGSPLNFEMMKGLYSSIPEASTLMSSAKANYNFAMVLSYAGGFMVGWPLGTAIAGGDPQWILAGLGAGIILLSIPVINGASKKVKQATDIYNKQLTYSNYEENSFKLGFQSTNHGIGLVLSF